VSMEEQRARQEEEARKAVAASVAETEVGGRKILGNVWTCMADFFVYFLRDVTDFVHERTDTDMNELINATYGCRDGGGSAAEAGT
jgi:hypothetical protein